MQLRAHLLADPCIGLDLRFKSTSCNKHPDCNAPRNDPFSCDGEGEAFSIRSVPGERESPSSIRNEKASSFPPSFPSFSRGRQAGAKFNWKLKTLLHNL